MFLHNRHREKMDNNSKHKLRKTLVKAMVAYILHMNLNLNDDTLIARDETERLLTNPGFARHSKLVSIVGPQALVIKITREMGALLPVISLNYSRFRS